LPCFDVLVPAPAGTLGGPGSVVGSQPRLWDQLEDAVIRSGRAVSETAAGFAVSWWMVRAEVTEACEFTLPDVDKLSPRMLGIDEHGCRSVRYFEAPSTKAWTRFVDEHH